jgi:rsbT co-antagonist protein RsbR
MRPENAALDELLNARRAEVLKGWIAEVAASGGSTAGRSDAAGEAAGLLEAVQAGVRADADPGRLEDLGWERLRGLLDSLSASRAAQGATAGDTNNFVLSFKKPVFAGLQQQWASQPDRLIPAIWAVSSLVDKMAQATMANYQRAREDVIVRQRQELIELSTPVVRLWDGVLAVPMIGTLDSARTQQVMETLLQRIVDTGSELAIIDITGVPVVDTLVAQHLLKTVTAIRLMGADCIISGVRPQIAQTIVHLGIDLQGIITKATLADALALALKRTGHVVTKAKA